MTVATNNDAPARGRHTFPATTTPTTASEVPESASTTASARTITYAWIILCAITILSWWLAPGWLKASTDAWLTVLWVAILGIYLF